METNTEDQFIEQPEPPRLELGNDIQVYLRETKEWAKFLAIVGFIFVGLMVLFALIFGFVISTLDDNTIKDVPWAVFGGVYLLFGVLCFFPVLYLYKFSEFMNKALKGKSTVDLSAAFRNLKVHYQFLGILTIVVISLYVISIILGILIAIGANF